MDTIPLTPTMTWCIGTLLIGRQQVKLYYTMQYFYRYTLTLYNILVVTFTGIRGGCIMSLYRAFSMWCRHWAWDERRLDISLLIGEGLITRPGGTLLQDMEGLLVCSQMRMVQQGKCRGMAAFWGWSSDWDQFLADINLCINCWFWVWLLTSEGWCAIHWWQFCICDFIILKSWKYTLFRMYSFIRSWETTTVISKLFNLLVHKNLQYSNHMTVYYTVFNTRNPYSKFQNWTVSNW